MCAPTLSMLTFFDGPNNGALFRIDNAYEVSETFTQFKPGWAGDHNFKFGGQYIYSTINLPDQTDMNGRFAFSTDKVFNASDPSTYPERLFIRVPAPSDITMPTHVGVMFAQDQWRHAESHDESRRALRPRDDADRQLVQPALREGDVCGRQEQRRAAAGRHLEPGRQREVAGSGRLRDLLRQGHASDHHAVRFDRACTVRPLPRSFPTARQIRVRAGEHCPPTRC